MRKSVQTHKNVKNIFVTWEFPFRSKCKGANKCLLFFKQNEDDLIQVSTRNMEMYFFIPG